MKSTSSWRKHVAFNKYSCLTNLDEHTEEGVITLCDLSETGKEESEEEPLEFGDVVLGLFVVYRMALFDHRVFDFGVAVEDSASSDYDEIQPVEVGSATLAVDDPVLSITGGGDQETNDVSPPSKRRKKGKGRAKQLQRRRKSSKSNLQKDVDINDGQDASDESGQNEIENVTPTTSPRLDRKAAWRKSPQGRASSAASNRKYEMSPLARSTRRRYKTSEEGIEKRRRYELLQERKESKKRNESTTKSKEARRRYRSAEGRFIRAAYSVTEGGRSAIKRAVQKYGNTEHGSESRRRAKEKFDNSEHGHESLKRAVKKYGSTKHGCELRRRSIQKYGTTEGGRKSMARARKKYELKEAAQKRKLRYKQRKAYYNRRVKKAIKHLNTQAAEITEPQRTNDDDPDQSNEEQPMHSKDGAENSRTNKEAMAAIRSHQVRHIRFKNLFYIFVNSKFRLLVYVN